MIYHVSSRGFQRFLQFYTFTYCYSEIVGDWSCQANTPLGLVLFDDEDFRLAREALFARHNLPDSVLTMPDVEETLLQKPVAALRGRTIMFTPISSVNKKDLLCGMAGKYIDLYKSCPDLPGGLAKQIDSSGNPNPSLSATLQSMQSAIQSLQASVRTQKLEKEALKQELSAVKQELSAVKQEVVTLQDCMQILETENESLKQEVAAVRQDLAVATRKLRMLGAMEHVLVRKLLDECRNKCKRELTAANIHFPANDWNVVIDDPSCLTLLTSLGLRREFGLQATRYGADAHMKQKGDKAAHVITEDRRLYAELVCSREGFERQSLVEIYKFVFPNSDPELEVFPSAQASMALLIQNS